MLTIAVQKTGRLHDHTMELLIECGISFANNGRNTLCAVASNFPLRILFLRDDDIPACVADRIADIGIVGENIVAEKAKKTRIVEKLDFAHCRLSIAIPKSKEYSGTNQLRGLTIATSYPRILSQYLESVQVSAEIHEISGSVEIAPTIGLADAIFDIVHTGSTLLSNGLKEVETVMNSQAVLISQDQIDNEKQELIDRLVFYIKAVMSANNFKYILLNVPNIHLQEICRILPGMKSPTVMPLALSGWSSLHSVIRGNEFWENIEKLKKLGAEGILVFPIEKMIV